MVKLIDSAVKEKVITLHLTGIGRNAIFKDLTKEGLRVSLGSISNFIKKYKLEHEQALQNHASGNDVSISVGVPTLAPAQNTLGQQPEVNADIITGVDINKTSSPASMDQGVGQKPTNSSVIGGPLSHLLGDNSTDDEVIAPDSSSIISIPTTIRNLKDLEVNIRPNVNVNSKNAKDQEQKYEQSGSSFEDSPSPIKLGIDWDSDENCERRVIRFIMEDKKWRRQELQLIEQGRAQVEQERQQIAQAQEVIYQRDSDLKAREANIAEIESLATSVRQLQQMGVTFDMMMSYIITVNERSVLGNVSTRAAALSISHDFKEYRSLGNILKTKQKAEQRLSELDMLITQRQAALNGIAERLTRLTDPNHSNNGHSDLSMNGWIKVNLLKGSTANMLNKMAPRYNCSDFH